MHKGLGVHKVLRNFFKNHIQTFTRKRFTKLFGTDEKTLGGVSTLRSKHSLRFMRVNLIWGKMHFLWFTKSSGV